MFRLDDGYIVLDEAAAHRGADAFAAIAAEWGEYHVTAIATVPDGATERKLAELARAAQSFDRIVICHAFHTAGSADAAARFARAVRGAGRTECHVVADAHRALRHCVEGMIRGDVVVYCCEDVDTAERILAEYGAEPAGKAPRALANAAAGSLVAMNGATGELTAAHI